MISDRVENGVDLLAHLEHDELALPDVVDRLEAITTEPAAIREILDVAETRGVIDRENATVRPHGAATLNRERDISTSPGPFPCERCGRRLSTGYFIDLEYGTHGPYGSTCIEYVVGRRE